MLGRRAPLAEAFFQPYQPLWPGGPPDLVWMTPGSGELSLPEIRERHGAVGIRCPRCDHQSVVRWGRFSGRQRYRCRGCTRTFSDFTGTPLAYSKYPHLWLEYADCLREALTVRKAGERLGIHKDTAFRWRHRFLDFLRTREEVRLRGIVEAHYTTFLYSEKGQRGLRRSAYRGHTGWYSHDRPLVRVLYASDRQSIWATVLGQVRHTKPARLSELLTPRLGQVRMLVSRGGRISPLALFARSAGIRYRRWDSLGVRASAPLIHAAQLKRYDLRLRSWLRRFLGVATKYLESYLAWHRLLEAHERPGTGARLLLAVLGIPVPTPFFP